ncbi:hypothetical protein BRADI_5g07755v3 [Brachypodium distachyon]|uniref:Uncharacterized protein n=1 Tax=Brachypodium distachyon TaxID=15368 RepID=A0A0Q3E7G3_BRADI|nr:hypothetical protein BRADI_5g07755v3 [Brachypodium distachyon]
MAAHSLIQSERSKQKNKHEARNSVSTNNNTDAIGIQRSAALLGLRSCFVDSIRKLAHGPHSKETARKCYRSCSKKQLREGDRAR